MVLNLLKAKENVNVPLNCPAAKKPQQIISSQPKHKQKVSALEHTKLHTVTIKHVNKKTTDISETLLLC